MFDTWQYAGRAKRFFIVTFLFLFCLYFSGLIYTGQYGLLLTSIIVLAMMETGVFCLVHFICARFNSITVMDRIPNITPAIVERFWEHGFDPELGWIRKKNTQKTDVGVPYKMDDRGSRDNPGHRHLETLFSTYGDSYTFCREVEDDETWQWHLSEMSGKNVLNFGVGNYGIDQAFLRLKREYPSNPTPFVIIGVVPDTIARIHSVWKHYNEYGNILAFKPRFELEGGELCLVPNIMTSKKKFFNLEQYIPHINRKDYFFERKFKPEAFRFPFILSFLVNINKILLFLVKISRAVLRKINCCPEKIFDYLIIDLLDGSMVKQAQRLYKEPEACSLLEKIIDSIVSYSVEKQFIPVLVILPMKDDVWYCRRKGNYYSGFFKSLQTKICTIDMMAHLSQDNSYEDYFKQWHYNNRGNQLVARAIYKELNKDLKASTS